MLVGLIMLNITGCSKSIKKPDPGLQLRIGWRKAEEDNIRSLSAEATQVALNYNDIVTFAFKENIGNPHLLRLDAFDADRRYVMLEPEKISWICETDASALRNQKGQEI